MAELARSFDGVDDIIIFSNMAEFNGAAQLTAVSWFRTATFVNTAVQITKLSADALNGFTIQQGASTIGTSLSTDILLTVRNGSVKGGFTTGLGLATDTWHWVALIYDGSQTGDANRLKCWVNGVAKTLDFSVFPGVPATVGSNVGSVCVGESDLAAEFFWNGDLYRSAAWTVVLTDPELTRLANGEPPCAIRPDSLVFYAPLHNGDNPEPNLGTAGGTGTVVGTTTVAAPNLAYPSICPPRSAFQVMGTMVIVNA